MSIVCLGEALVDLILLPGRRGEPERFAAYAGGALANVAVAVARAGAPAALAGGSGRDAFGRFLRRSLTAEGVDVDRLGEIEDLITPFAFVRTDAEGEPEFRIHGDGIDAGLAPLRGNEGEVLRGAEALVIGSNTLVAEPGLSVTTGCIAAASGRALPVLFDPNLRPHRWAHLETAIGRCRDVAASATVIKANAAEARLLTGAADADPEAAAGALLELGPSLAVVTAGPAGAVARTRAGSLHRCPPAGPIEDPQPLGAGDAFMGTLAAGLRRHEWDLERLAEVLPLAAAAGAAACGHRGAIA